MIYMIDPVIPCHDVPKIPFSFTTMRYQNFEFVEAGTEDPDLLGVSWHSRPRA
jgi:hypothetical protein